MTHASMIITGKTDYDSLIDVINITHYTKIIYAR